jgi:hypothetical protein
MGKKNNKHTDKEAVAKKKDYVKTTEGTKNGHHLANAPEQEKKKLVQAELKRPSPAKANKPLPTAKSQQKGYRLSCINFTEDIPFELYFLEKSEDEDAFSWGVAKYIGDKERGWNDAAFDACNFTRVLERRIPFSDNEAWKNDDSKKYPRRLFIRWPTEKGSTPDTRKQGLEAFKNLLGNKHTGYTVRESIELVDVTDYEAEPPISMDKYMMNDDIDFCIRNEIAESELKKTFKKTYPALAKTLWRGRFVSELGKEMGFEG